VWTASDWGRGTEGLVAQRGGSGLPGELGARCANGRGAKPDTKAIDVGVRCCAGPVNPFEVTLAVTRGEGLHYRRGDDALAEKLTQVVRRLPSFSDALLDTAPPDGGVAPLADTFTVERSWTWHPVGNEELVLGGGCTRPGDDKACGVLVARLDASGPRALAWMSTDHWQPTVGELDTSRVLWVYGGDEHGAFRKRLSYEWGHIGIGDKERKKKRGKKYYFD
jgi:hypothetical protein